MRRDIQTGIRVKEDDEGGSIVLTPAPARLTLTGQVPKVHMPEPQELVADSRRRRWRFAAVGLGGALLDLAAGSVGGSGSHGLSMAGLILDIAGASLLTTGLMLPDWLIEEMGFARYDENLSITTYWQQTRGDARLAVWLLFAGFALQAVGTAFSF